MNSTRTNYSIKNSISSLISNFISFFFVFISQSIFIKILGAEYLGLNGLFSNILSVLSIFELGIGSAIVYNLYKPIASNDEKTISALVNFYKKAYFLIASIILLFGILILPFIKYTINDINIDINIYIVYLLFLGSTISSYFIAYKRSLIIAFQKNYIINIVHAFYLIFLNLSQILILVYSKNYYLYLSLKIIYQIFENFAIMIYANKNYKFLNEYKKCKIDKKTEKDIFTRVKALFLHKIGGIIVSGTDNIIISKFFNLVTVGLYNNYNIIFNGVNLLFSQLISTTTASIGNLLTNGDVEKNFEVFKKIRFLNYWISVFTSVSILTIINSFVTIWIGKEYIISFFVVVVLVFNYFQKMQRQVYMSFKDAGGIWIEDKYVSLIESLLNIFFSILCLKIFGLAGVFMGTIISGLILWCYSYPKFVYRKLFARSYLDYARETLGYILLFAIIACETYLVSYVVVFNNVWLQLISNTIIAVTVPNLTLVLIFRKKEEFNYFVNLLKKMLTKIMGRVMSK